MSWRTRFRCRMFLRSSLCVPAIVSMAAALLAAPLIRLADDRMQWTLMGFGLEGSRLVVGALASSLLTFIVFAFSIILLLVQVAGGQLTPRIIARIFETRLTRQTVSAFVFSYVYSLAALGRIEERVPQLPVLIAVLSSLLSVALFLSLIQTAGRNVRPIMILTRVGDDTRNVIQALYPEPFSPHRKGQSPSDFPVAPAHRTVVYGGPSGTVLAFHAVQLADYARRADGRIVLLPQVGDFLATGEELFQLYGDFTGIASDEDLICCVALGTERILDHDPAFGFRILVDIASKALSPAINDPTTAALVIDQLHPLLHLLAGRELDSGVIRDSSGRVRLAYRVPGWEDYVALAVTEIRTYGAGNPQVTRRLQALFEKLLPIVPEARAAALRQEQALLQRTINRSFAEEEDRTIAGTADWQGFGSRPFPSTREKGSPTLPSTSNHSSMTEPKERELI